MIQLIFFFFPKKDAAKPRSFFSSERGERPLDWGGKRSTKVLFFFFSPKIQQLWQGSFLFSTSILLLFYCCTLCMITRLFQTEGDGEADRARDRISSLQSNPPPVRDFGLFGRRRASI